MSRAELILCDACRAMADAADLRQDASVVHSDATVPAEIERAAIALFTYDNLDHKILWQNLDEKDRSSLRDGAIAVVKAWVGQPS
jgi:hypothetical protein